MLTKTEAFSRIMRVVNTSSRGVMQRLDMAKSIGHTGFHTSKHAVKIWWTGEGYSLEITEI